MNGSTGFLHVEHFVRTMCDEQEVEEEEEEGLL